MAITNKEFAEKFDQAHSAQIEKMFWIAGSSDHSDIEELLQDISDNEWDKLIPELGPSKNEYFFEYLDGDVLTEMLVENDKFGLIAEICIPECSRFIYDENNIPVAWSTHPGIRRIKYAYAESLEALFSEVEKIANEVFEDYKAEDKKRRQSEPTNSEA